MRRLAGLMVLCLVALPASAQEAAFERFALDEGLSDYSILAVTRDDAGFLWVGTQAGLNRYDGARVRVFGLDGEDGLDDGYIELNGLTRSGRGRFWVNTRGGTLYRYEPEEERFTPYVPALPEGARISRLAFEPDGTLWIGTHAHGLHRYDSETGEAVAFRSSPEDRRALPSDTLRALTLGPDGTLWIGTPSALTRRDAEGFSTFSLPPGVGTLSALAADEAGVWAGTNVGFVLRLDPETERFTSYRVAANVFQLEPSRARPGSIWVGTRGHGLHRLDTNTGRAEPVASAAGPSERADILALVEDRDGLLWIGTATGLFKTAAYGLHFTPIQRDPEATSTLSASGVTTIYEAPSEPGVAWVGTLRGGLNRLDRRTGTIRHLFDEPGHPLNLVFAMHEDRERTLWAGGVGAALYTVDRETGATEALPLPPASRVVQTIYAAPSNPDVLWIGTQGAGLVRFDPMRRTVEAVHLEGQGVWSVREDPARPGMLWIGTSGAGLHRLDALTGETERIEAAGCEAAERIVSLAFGSEGVLWLGTFDRGLFRLDLGARTCRHFTRADGLAWDDVAAIYRDELGRLWLPSSNGLSLYDPARDVFTRFSRADGLQDNVFHYQAHFRAADGTLMLGGANGLNAFDPLSIRVDTTPPPMAITRLRINGRPHPLVRDRTGRFRPLRLAHNENDIAFEYAALDLRQPAQNAYRVRLEGAEDAWRSVGAQTVERYPLLAAGRYTFHVMGSNRDGTWSEAVAVPFVVRPPWWRTWWFWSLVAFSTLALVVAFFQVRYRALVRLEQTRRRIADDLHDDIGSKMSTVALRLDLVGRSTGVAEAERAQLAAVAGTARAVVDDLRDAIWVVDAGNDDLRALAERMEQFADQLLRGRSHTFHVPDDLPPVVFPMERRRHLYFLFKEALNNAVRHGQPEHVDVRLTHDDGRLGLTVRDDGVGFDPAARSNGRGLTTLHSRAEALGGDLLIESAPGHGTTLRLTIPLD